jgi:hypothetical protein
MGLPSLVLAHTLLKEDVLKPGSKMVIGLRPKQRVISLICVKSLEEVQLQLRLPHLQLRKLLAVDKWLQ